MTNEIIEKVLDFLGKAKPATLVAAITLAGIFGVTKCSQTDDKSQITE